MIKSALRYPGGKSRVCDMLLANMPVKFKEYREPFLGGGSVFLAAKQSNHCESFWLNDLYYDLYCFWINCRDKAGDIVRKIYKLKEEWGNDGKGLHKYLVENIASFNEEDKAVAFFILNRITFSGTSLSGGFSKAAFEGRFTDSSIERVLKMSPLLKDCKITNEDYSVLLREPGDDVFIFLDPPYYSATDSALYGKNGELHKGFDHERFANEIKDCKHRWMITYDDCEYIRNLFNGFKITPFEFAYGMRNVKKENEMKGKEILIMNY